MAGLLLGSGTLGDRVGHRRMFLIGLVVFGAASLVAAFSPTQEALIGSRAFLAVGAAAMMPATLALIRVTFEDERERNVAIAVWGTMAVVGTAPGPIISGILLQHFWWGSVFIINVPVVVIALVATLALAPPNDPDPSKHWDLVSSLLALVALVGLVMAIKDGEDRPRFGRHRRRRPRGDGRRMGLRQASTSTASPLAGIRDLPQPGVPLRGAGRRVPPVRHLRRPARHHSALSVGGGVHAAARRVPRGGRRPRGVPHGDARGAVLHRVGLLPLITGGLALGAGGTVLVLLNFATSMPLLVTGLIVTGAGLGAAMSVASSAIMGNVPARRAGMASSVEEVSYEFGGLIAVALLGSLLTARDPRPSTFRPGCRSGRGDSLDSALALAGEGAGADTALITAASEAFDGAYFAVMTVVAAALAVGTPATGLLLRRHGPGINTVRPRTPLTRRHGSDHANQQADPIPRRRHPGRAAGGRQERHLRLRRGGGRGDEGRSLPLRLPEDLVQAIHQHLRPVEADLVAAAGKSAAEATPGERLAAYTRVSVQSSTRAELLLMLEGSTNPAHAAVWDAVTERRALSAAGAEGEREALDRFIVRLAADGLWLYESLTPERLAPQLRRAVADRIAEALARDER
ncbi:Putative multidrug resistance protein MdtD [Streptomyces californicus]